MQPTTTVRLAFETLEAEQAEDALAGYEWLEGDHWHALLAPGLDRASLTKSEHDLISEAAIEARREGRVCWSSPWRCLRAHEDRRDDGSTSSAAPTIASHHRIIV